MFELEHKGKCYVFCSGDKRLRIHFWSSYIVRISYTERREFVDRDYSIVCGCPMEPTVTAEETRHTYILRTEGLTVTVCRDTGALSYYGRNGTLLTREPRRGGKWLTRKDVYRNVFNSEMTEAISVSIDGARSSAEPTERVFDRQAFEARLDFEFREDEALFGFGSHEEGFGNLRGKWRDLYQQNLKAVVPFLVSTRGYGILFHCGSAMSFHDDAIGSWWWADCVDELDFFVIAGDHYDQVHQSYHALTGRTPMLPQWAFGYLQSKERYVNAKEMLEVVREYRRRRIPLDGIILDWKSWPSSCGWGQKQLDEERFPDPATWIQELHSLGVHLIVSIWPTMTGGCADQLELIKHGWMLGNQSTYNAFLPEARECYWRQAEHGLFAKGVDGWWCDCTEPFESDWSGAVKPERHRRFIQNTTASQMYLDAAYINLYSLAHAKGIYEGQRSTGSKKRVVNLTRSSYAGQHRYGTITWNGDVCATWAALRCSIAEGINFCASGEPYWTVDIGGFFIDYRPDCWFWRGDYSDGCRGLTAMDACEPDPRDAGCRDLGYWELYTRWLQYAAFLPMFRSHGTDAAREIWRFGEEGTLFYDAIAKFIRLRYQFIPYLYSLAARVTNAGVPFISAVALRYPGDKNTYDLLDQFCLGPSLMVCPVTVPMYYERNSRRLSGVPFSRPVYLPTGREWFDFWTNQLFSGGQCVVTDAPLDRIPLFVPCGSIIPMAGEMQNVAEGRDGPYEIRVYAGADAHFDLYEDAGDSYDYESGMCAVVRMNWMEQQQTFTIEECQGWFPEMVAERHYRIVLMNDVGCDVHEIIYKGERLSIRRRPVQG